MSTYRVLIMDFESVSHEQISDLQNSDTTAYLNAVTESFDKSAFQSQLGSYSFAYNTAKSYVPYLPYGQYVHTGLNIGEAAYSAYLNYTTE